MSESDRDIVRTAPEVAGRLGKIKHDANNPLAIVSGNAQLLRELAAIEGLGEEFVGPINDIIDASERVAEALNELTVLQRLLLAGRQD
jgi:signal transduction histidine kinase